MYSLRERLLLCKLGAFIFQIPPHRESMINTAVQRHLVWESMLALAQLLQDLLGLVPFIRREDIVRLGSRDRERSGDGSEFLLVDEGRVSCEACVDHCVVLTADITEVSAYILCSLL